MKRQFLVAVVLLVIALATPNAGAEWAAVRFYTIAYVWPALVAVGMTVYQNLGLMVVACWWGFSLYLVAWIFRRRGFNSAMRALGYAPKSLIRLAARPARGVEMDDRGFVIFGLGSSSRLA